MSDAPRLDASARRAIVVAALPRHVRAAAARAVPLLPPPHAQPVGRRGSGRRTRCARRSSRSARCSASCRIRARGCSASPRTCGSIACGARIAARARRRSAAPTRRGRRRRAASREAAGTLLVQLAPQERAAVVLKDVFDFSLEEIADALSTTAGAVKAALHRGRGKLVEPQSRTSRAPAPGVLDAFCAAFNARDLQRADRAAARQRDRRDRRRGHRVRHATRPAIPRPARSPAALAPITFDERGGVAAPNCSTATSAARRAARSAPYRGGTVLAVLVRPRPTGPTVRARDDRRDRRRPDRAHPQLLLHARRDRRGLRELGVPYRGQRLPLLAVAQSS